MDYPLEEELVDDHTMNAPRIHRGCVLELLYEKYLINLVPIPLSGTKIIMGMDWLTRNGDIIDCEHHLVRVQTPSTGELVIHCEATQRGSAFCSVARDRRYL